MARKALERLGLRLPMGYYSEELVWREHHGSSPEDYLPDLVRAGRFEIGPDDIVEWTVHRTEENKFYAANQYFTWSEAWDEAWDQIFESADQAAAFARSHAKIARDAMKLSHDKNKGHADPHEVDRVIREGRRPSPPPPGLGAGIQGGPKGLRLLDQQLYDFAKQIQSLAAMSKYKPNRVLKYSSIADIIIQEGRIYDPTPYTPDEEQAILSAFESLSHTPKIKQCYYNAQSIALDGGLGYAEGYFASDRIPIPIEHAFNTLPSGKAVDVTLQGPGDKNTCDPKKLLARAKRNQVNAYLGIEIPDGEIRKSWLRNKMSILLLEDPVIQGMILEKGYPKAWRSPSLGANKEWEEASHIDPRPSVDGVYLVAYVGAPPTRRKETESPVTSKATHVRDVGVFPVGAQFGSDFMFHPIAAIPVHPADVGLISDYLSEVISGLKLFGKIVLLKSFPEADVIDLPNGRWFPVAQEPREWAGLKFLNAYNVGRAYGGPEEGGWWYDVGSPLASAPFLESNRAAHWESELEVPGVLDWLPAPEGFRVREFLKMHLFDQAAEIFVEEQFAAPFPSERPRYS